MDYRITDDQLNTLQGFSQAPKFLEILKTVKGQPEESVGGWNAEDMQTACQMHGFTLSDEDAVLALIEVEDNLDADQGIDWESIWSEIEDMAKEGDITLRDWKEDQTPT